MIETIEDFMVAGAKAASALSRHVVEGRGAVSIRLDLDNMGELVLTLDLEPEDASNCAATFAEVYDALIAAGIGHDQINQDFDIQPLGVAVNRAVVSMPAPVVTTADVVDLDRLRAMRRAELLD